MTLTRSRFRWVWNNGVSLPCKESGDPQRWGLSIALVADIFQDWAPTFASQPKSGLFHHGRSLSRLFPQSCPGNLMMRSGSTGQIPLLNALRMLCSVNVFVLISRMTRRNVEIPQCVQPVRVASRIALR